MKKLAVLVLVATLMSACVVPSVKAQASAAPAKQSELAELLVNLLGLSQYLPASPTAQQVFAALLANSIAPANGWNAKASVTKADLARVIVQAMGQASDVQNPDNPQSWVNHLKGLNVSLDSIGNAVDGLSPLSEPVAGNLSQAGTTWDPLDNVARFGEPDEREFGADAASAAALPAQAKSVPAAAPAPAVVVTTPEIRQVIRQVSTPDRPVIQPPVTPN